MPKILVAYYSATGNTKKLAEAISEAILSEGVKVDLKKIEDIKVDSLPEYDGYVFGSPTYYGAMAYQIKKVFDESVKFHGKLEGKIAGAFSTSANIAGGNETTILEILNAFLIHGMIVQGDPKGDHYGPVSIGAPDDNVLRKAERFGKRIAQLAKKIFD